MHRDDPNLLEHISDVLSRYFLHGERTADIMFPDNAPIAAVGSLSLVPNMLQRKAPHDPDYIVFRAFTGARDVVLDIGADWGYSVGSIWRSGASCRVISFEPWPPHRDRLQSIAERFPGRYDYRMVALCSAPGTVRLAVPMVNSIPLTGLASGLARPHIPSLATNIDSHIKKWITGVSDIRISVHEYSAPAVKLDDILQAEHLLASDEQVAAIKIDVEGLELDVLQGAASTLERYTPLVMSEGGNRTPGISELMTGLGYCYAERDGDRLVQAPGKGRARNGFFVHAAILEAYRGAGLLADAWIS
jgi:FkbM family methyltransferase